MAGKKSGWLKRAFRFVLQGLLCFVLITGCLGGCGTKEDKVSYGEVSAYEIAYSAYLTQENFADGQFDVLDYREDTERQLFGTLYSVSEQMESISDCYAFVSATNLADEIAVVVATEETVEAVATGLEKRLEERIAMFEGYEPTEVDKLQDGQILTYGKYVVYLVCDDMKGAKTVVEEVVKEGYIPKYDVPTPMPDGSTPVVSISPEPTFTPTPTEEVLPNNPEVTPEATPEPTPTEAVTPTQKATPTVTPKPPTSTPTTIVEPSVYGEGYEYGYPEVLVEAVQTNDVSLLTSDRDIELFYRCRELLNEWITDDMTNYEKEKAVFTMLVAELKYDKAHYSIAGEDPNSVNPYGALIQGKAICTGYANSFQLFMTILNIPCINVEGSAFDDYQAHCWNMVQLDGAWYYVDVCWGDSGRDSGGNYKYLNATTEHMLNTEHHWDTEAYPYVEKTYSGE